MQTIEESAKQMLTATQFFINYSTKGLIKSGKVRKEDEDHLILAFMELMEQETQEFKRKFNCTLPNEPRESRIFTF